MQLNFTFGDVKVGLEVLGRRAPLHEQSTAAIEDEDEGRPVRQVLNAHAAPRQLGDRTVLPVDHRDELPGWVRVGEVQSSNMICNISQSPMNSRSSDLI